MPNWGFGEDNCGNETHLHARGDIIRRGDVVTSVDKPFLLDIVGRYRVDICGRSYDTVCAVSYTHLEVYKRQGRNRAQDGLWPGHAAAAGFDTAVPSARNRVPGRGRRLAPVSPSARTRASSRGSFVMPLSLIHI